MLLERRACSCACEARQSSRFDCSLGASQRLEAARLFHSRETTHGQLRGLTQSPAHVFDDPATAKAAASRSPGVMVGPLEASWKAITDTLAPVVTTVSSVAEKAGDTVVTAARTTVLAKRDVEKQGTPLRDGIRAARESWNAAIRAADGAATSAARETNEFATLAKARTAPLAPFYTAVHDTYVARPEALVTGVALVPFVATLPFSKSLAVKNGAVAALLVGAPVAAMKVLDSDRD